MANATAQPATDAAAAVVDTDGDGQPDATDPAPLDPANTPPAAEEPAESPGPGLAAVLAVVGLALLLRRR